MKINYHLEMLNQLETLKEVPRLLLHSCCAPCSTRAITLLSKYFLITVYYYNPNIEPVSEYERRKSEQIRLIDEFKSVNPISFLDAVWENECFLNVSRGLESSVEGGLRCTECFLLRMDKTAEKAKELNFDYFATTLTVSPHKNSALINKIGGDLSTKYDISYLYSDFKKENGYKKSIEYSKKYALYRQDYCGCKFSYLERQLKSRGD